MQSASFLNAPVFTTGLTSIRFHRHFSRIGQSMLVNIMKSHGITRVETLCADWAVELPRQWVTFQIPLAFTLNPIKTRFVPIRTPQPRAPSTNVRDVRLT